jgi:hypothetical protein
MLWDSSLPGESTSTVPIKIPHFKVQMYLCDNEEAFFVVEEIKWDWEQQMFISLDLQQEIKTQLEQMFHWWWNNEKERFDSVYADRIQDQSFVHDKLEQTISGTMTLWCDVVEK